MRFVRWCVKEEQKISLSTFERIPKDHEHNKVIRLAHTSLRLLASGPLSRPKADSLP